MCIKLYNESSHENRVVGEDVSSPLLPSAHAGEKTLTCTNIYTGCSISRHMKGDRRGDAQESTHFHLAFNSREKPSRWAPSRNWYPTLLFFQWKIVVLELVFGSVWHRGRRYTAHLCSISSTLARLCAWDLLTGKENPRRLILQKSWRWGDGGERRTVK